VGWECKVNLGSRHRSVLLHRLQHHLKEGEPAPDRIYPTFSVAHAAGACLVAAALCLLLSFSNSRIPPLLWKLIELFEIREIFAVELLSEAAVKRFYRLLVLLLIVVVVLKLVLYLTGLFLSALVLLSDRLIVAEWGVVRSRIHHLPYSKVVRLSTEENFLHRMFGVGMLRVFTTEAGKPVSVGPIPRFSAALSRLLAFIEKT